MDFLWTPWRYQYIAQAIAGKQPECIFCDAAARHIRDKPHAWIAIGFGLLFVRRDLDNPPGDRFGPFFRNGEEEISENPRLWHDISLDDSRPRPVLDGGK